MLSSRPAQLSKAFDVTREQCPPRSAEEALVFQDRALLVKSLDAEQRMFTGIATTSQPDRHGDIVDLAGVQFKNPLPLLFHHDPTQPVGTVKFFPATPTGIAFEARLPRIEEPGRLKDRVDEAWQSVKAGLITSVSIGYRVLDNAVQILRDGGAKLLKTEVFELSLVTIPANAHASILTVKALEGSAPAATGLHPPGVSGPSLSARKDAPSMKPIPEQIAAFDMTRRTKADRMAALMAASADTMETLDAAQTEEYDTLEREVKSIDAHLSRLRTFEQTNLVAATPITASTSPDQASALRDGQRMPVIQVKSLLPKGTGFTRYAMALAFGRGDSMKALRYAEQWRDSTPEVELALKAAVAPGTTADATWASPLAPLQPLAAEFLELLRPATLIGRIPNLRRVPFNVSVAAQTAGGTYGWVGQGAPKPVTKLGFGTVQLGIAKAAGIIVLTEELVRTSTPSAEEAVRQDMIAGIATFLDAQFTDPAVAAVLNVSPASITNGLVAIASAGATPDDARTDIRALIGALLAANLSVANAALLMSEANANALGTALNPLGQPLFPGLSATGGAALGIPVYTSQSLGNNVILVDARGILFADDGGVNIDVSREATIQMDSAPDDPVVDATVLTSFWQQNLVGLRAERFINWARGRDASVQYVVQAYV